MHLLLVEDDPRLQRVLRRLLEDDRHVVELAADGETALELADATAGIEAVILDVGLPDMTGLQVAQRLRKDGRDLAILMLTARDTVNDRVAGLDAGADDYLVKPFAFDELLARLRALTRRGRTRHLDVSLHYGPLSLDTATHVATAGGQPLDLSATEYRLLEHLLRHQETIVSRDQLAEHVWGGDYDPFSNVADVYIGYLRRTLRAAGVATPLIHTIRGLGYMLKARPAGEAAELA
jgi:DNA-binding response OmpR family regulator